jgi:hypothetical protein
MKTESRVMAVGAFRHFLPILGPEIPKHQVRALGSRKIGEAVDPAVFTNPVSSVHMVGVRLLGEPRPSGLLGGEEALLGLGYFMEPPGGFFIRSCHCIFPQLSWGIMRHRCARRQEAPRITLFLQGFTGTLAIQPGSPPKFFGEL